MRAAVEQDTQMRTPAHIRLTAVGGSERRAGDVRAKAKAVVGEDPEATVDGAHDRFLPQPPEAADARLAVVPDEQAAFLPQRIVVRTVRPEIGRATSELQSLMRISYAVFCLKQKNKQSKNQANQYIL